MFCQPSHVPPQAQYGLCNSAYSCGNPCMASGRGAGGQGGNLGRRHPHLAATAPHRCAHSKNLPCACSIRSIQDPICCTQDPCAILIPHPQRVNAPQHNPFDEEVRRPRAACWQRRETCSRLLAAQGDVQLPAGSARNCSPACPCLPHAQGLHQSPPCRSLPSACPVFVLEPALCTFVLQSVLGLRLPLAIKRFWCCRRQCMRH